MQEDAHSLLKEIKAKTRWSLEEIADRADITIDALKKIHRTPGYRGARTTRRLLAKLHRTQFQPFPESIEALMRHMDDVIEALQGQPSRIVLYELTELFAPRFGQHPEWNSGGLGDARLKWGLGHVYFEVFRISKWRDLEAYSKADDNYAKAIELIRSHGREDGESQVYKLMQSRVAMKFNQCEEGKRTSSEPIRAWLTDMKYLEEAFKVAKREPWNLALLRNALVAASVLESREACSRLVKLIRALRSDFFEPGVVALPGLKPADSDGDLVFVYESGVLDDDEQKEEENDD